MTSLEKNIIIIMTVAVHGAWGTWTVEVACTAACESEGFERETRTCSAPQYEGDECTRSDLTITTLENRIESKETICKNTLTCPSKYFKAIFLTRRPLSRLGRPNSV